MTLRLRVDPGGEKYLPFAKKKLVELKAWMKQSGLTTFTKRYFINGTEQILVNSLLLSYGQSLDTIRILFSAGYTDYVLASFPNPVPYRHVSVVLSSDSMGVIAPGGTQYIQTDATTYVYCGDEVLVQEPLTYLNLGIGVWQYVPGRVSSEGYTTLYPWNGGGSTWMFEQREYEEDMGYEIRWHHTLAFDIPEDAISPGPGVVAPTYYGNDGREEEWAAAWQAGAEAFRVRRRAWLKKNSDEFIAALKYGFAATYIDSDGNEQPVPDVTQPALQTGELPDEWRRNIKRAINNQYASYPPPDTIGRKTRRDYLFEFSLSDALVSDTSMGGTQAGVRVTRRTAILHALGGDDDEPHEIEGYLTQTYTLHTGVETLTVKHEFDNWFVDDDDLEVIDEQSVDWPYELDTGYYIRTPVTGVVQTGYYVSDYPFAYTYANAVPPYPAAYQDVVAVVPTWIDGWHRDSKIIYLKDGVGASTEQNDSALHGVNEVHISPIGGISSGGGYSPDGTNHGIFPNSVDIGSDISQLELFGTAVYNFDWQTGALVFKTWKPLHDSDGNEVASKIIDLPEPIGESGWDYGTGHAICLITYKGIHWPDVVTALKTRDKTLEADNPLLYTLIQAVKAG